VAQDVPDWQKVVKVVPSFVPGTDVPDWEKVVIGPGGSSLGGYASLTGPGETVTPGQLTQAGAFAVTGELSFFGVPLAPQQPVPTTLGEVITYLGNYGLWGSSYAYDTYIAGLGPAVWYKFNEASGPNVTDYSGNGHTGSYASSGVTYQVMPGPISGSSAAGFDGATGGASASTYHQLTPTSAFTVVVWFQGVPSIWAPSLASTADVFNVHGGLNLLVGTLGGNATIAAGFGTLTGFGIIQPTFTADTNWHMIAFVGGYELPSGPYAGDWTFLMLDGVVIDAYTGGPFTYEPGGNVFNFGIPYGADNYYQGNVAQFTYWDSTALTPAQIATAYGYA